jgi:uncharacterized membrane protein SpoIIM required for sporulation
VRPVADTLRIAGSFVALSMLVALVVRVAAAAPARSALGFGFSGIPDEPAKALDVFLNNAQVALGCVGGALLARLRSRVVVRITDVILGGAVVINAVVVGTAVGAYGERMLRALVPHGPLEVLAVSAAGSLYVAARRGRVRIARAALLLAAALAGLATAAVLETYCA